MARLVPGGTGSARRGDGRACNPGRSHPAYDSPGSDVKRYGHRRSDAAYERKTDGRDGQRLLVVRQSARERGFTLFWRHGLRNVALPAVTLQFASFSELFGGAVLAEQVFSYPGLGQAAVEAGLRGDVPLLLGIVLFSAVFVYTGNVLADLAYRLIDPRMKAGGGA